MEDKELDYLLLPAIRKGNSQAFTYLFKAYYSDLVLFCGNFIADRSTCEDIVQSIFLKLWNRRSTLRINTSLKSYLLTAVRNSCVDDHRHMMIIREHVASFTELYSYDTENYILYSDLNEKLQKAIAALPDSCRETFIMSRLEGKKNREIAEILKVSERTVEERIRKSMTVIRKHLSSLR